MPLSFRKRVIQVKVESTYATDPTIAAADSLLTRGLEIRPLEGQYQGRDLVDGSLGVQPEELVNVHSAVRFQHEACGGGAAGTAPVWADALLACGFAETVNAGTSVVYDLVSDTYSSVALRAHIGGTDGHRQLLLGGRGRWGFTANANELPYFDFDMRALFGAAVKEAPPTVDYSAHLKPPRTEPDQVTAFTIGGDTLAFRQFTVEGGHAISVNRYANVNEVSMGDRALTGRVVVRMPAIDAKDLIAETRAGTLQALALTIGATAGNIVSLAAPAVQIKFAGYEDNEGDLDVALDLNFTPSSGDDEVTFTVT